MSPLMEKITNEFLPHHVPAHNKILEKVASITFGKAGRKYISKVNKAADKTFNYGYGAGMAALGGAAAMDIKARKRKEN